MRKLREEQNATLTPVIARSSQITQTTVDEITDWRVFFPTGRSKKKQAAF